MKGKTSSSKATQVVAPSIINTIDNTTTRKLAIISLQEAKNVALRDASSVSTAPDEYVELNKFSYYVIINTWLFQVDEVSERGCIDLLDAICKLGLLPVIAACDGTANSFIAEQYALNEYDGTRSIIPRYLVHLLSGCVDDKQALQLLRYPKRFSPDGADLIMQASIDSFITINNRCKLLNRRETSQFWVERIRSRIGDMLDGYAVDWSLGFFSSGVAADARRPLMDKLFAYSDWEPCLYHDALYAIGRDVIQHDGAYTAVVQPVPKSYKTARIIAEEHAYRQFHMQAIRMEIERCLEVNGYTRYLDLHDQRPNQLGAQRGSISGAMATIDLSSASDSIGRNFAYNILPTALVHDLDRYLPTHFRVGKKQHIMHMFCTSGSAVTFPVESVIFLAISLEVASTCTRLTGDTYHTPIVFGDDILVDVKLFDTVCEVLTQLGFVVNDTKSYGPGSSYRESCGVEYTDGYSLQSTYWPRSTIKWSKDSLATTIAQLCSLQHGLYGTYKAGRFLAEVVRILEPRMTSHTVGTDCIDLWEDIPVFKEGYAPGLEGSSEPGAKREMHLTLRTVRTNKLAQVAPSGFSGWSVVEMWLYARFLRFGPAFDDELSRLLGVSTKPPTRASHSDVGTVQWGWVKE